MWRYVTRYLERPASYIFELQVLRGASFSVTRALSSAIVIVHLLLLIAEELSMADFSVDEFINEIIRLSSIPYLECSTCTTRMTRMTEIKGHPIISVVMCKACVGWWRAMNDIKVKSH